MNAPSRRRCEWAKRGLAEQVVEARSEPHTERYAAFQIRADLAVERELSLVGVARLDRL